MATNRRSQNYPVYLNPFGEEEEEEKIQYPDHLSPFDDDDDPKEPDAIPSDGYDDSLNPFGDAESETTTQVEQKSESFHNTATPTPDVSNPFDEEERHSTVEDLEVVDEVVQRSDKSDEDEVTQCDSIETHDDEPQQDGHQVDETKAQSTELGCYNSILTQNSDPQPESIEPPVPVPRTKKLLKKEQRQRQLVLQQSQSPESSDHANHQSLSSSINSSASANNSISNQSSIREKKKRNAPPVPINYKRQVSGSLEEIEMELNEIGDKLAAIEKESTSCQESLRTTYQVDETQFACSKAEYIQLMERKNSISRRQKELMYRKRELKLDQIYSDIEYELRMIGNKQLSNRTAEDESKEKELLQKLVEIVEEKNDIVENLNKDSSSDNLDIKEALRRLNIGISDSEGVKSNSDGVNVKKENCDKNGITVGKKFSKIATLLPKGGTIKGSIKLKRKNLFKVKSESHKVDR